MDETRCKEKVWERSGWPRAYQCNRKAVKDGYCKQHHPDAVKEREDKSQQRYEENKRKSDWYRLGEVTKQYITIKAAAENILFKRKQGVPLEAVDFEWLERAVGEKTS